MTTADGLTCDFEALNKMYRKMYWKQIFDFKTSWTVKKIAVQSLLIMWRWK